MNPLPTTDGGWKVVLADPPTQFKNLWNEDPQPDKDGNYPGRSIEAHYPTMSFEDLCVMPVREIVAKDAVLFLWTCWPIMPRSLEIIEAWGFTYKTCAFSWMKADPYRLFADDKTPFMGAGYWTRANTEPCLLATRGKPKRKHADVRQAIISPRREHSRKPDEIHGRIERLVDGPYLELFGRAERNNWTVWGNETGKFQTALG